MMIFWKDITTDTDILCKIFNHNLKENKADSLLYEDWLFYKKEFDIINGLTINKTSQIHKENFNIHTGHIGGSSQSEWIGEYTVLEGGRREKSQRISCD